MALIQAHGLWILAPFTVLEGPIVTILAAYLAQRGFMPVIGVYLVCIAGDLVGDALLYALGRFGAGRLPARVTRFLGMTQARQLALSAHFTERGGRSILFGKWTHSAGAPILIAAGMARMQFAPYLWFNLLGTVPKTLVLVLVGYYFGAAYGVIDTYIYRGSLMLLALVVLGGGLLWWRRA